MSDFVTVDSGNKETFDDGMRRNSAVGKTEWHRVADGPMLGRWAGLLTRGASVYPDDEAGSPNWMKAKTYAAYVRFRASAFRHFMQWFLGLDPHEDHAAAVLFNINGAEYTKERLNQSE